MGDKQTTTTRTVHVKCDCGELCHHDVVPLLFDISSPRRSRSSLRSKLVCITRPLGAFHTFIFSFSQCAVKTVRDIAERTTATQVDERVVG